MSGWTYFLKGWIWLPTKVKGTTDSNFNGPHYCSVTLASVRQSQCWVSVMALRESWVIFWAVEHFQKEVWKTPCGLGHFPRVGAIDLNPPLLSSSWSGERCLCPTSWELWCSQLAAWRVLTCWQQQYLGYPNHVFDRRCLIPPLEGPKSHFRFILQWLAQGCRGNRWQSTS